MSTYAVKPYVAAYGPTRFYAVYEQQTNELVAVTVYKRGATTVATKLNDHAAQLHAVAAPNTPAVSKVEYENLRHERDSLLAALQAQLRTDNAAVKGGKARTAQRLRRRSL